MVAMGHFPDANSILLLERNDRQQWPRAVIGLCNGIAVIDVPTFNEFVPPNSSYGSAKIRYWIKPDPDANKPPVNR